MGDLRAESAETYRRAIKQILDDISDVNALRRIYTLAYVRWEMLKERND